MQNRFFQVRRAALAAAEVGASMIDVMGDLLYGTMFTNYFILTSYVFNFKPDFTSFSYGLASYS